MLRDFRKNKIFNRRAVITAGAQAGLVSILVGRLGYLQIFKYEEYATMSDSNRIKPVIVPAARGMIIDRNGEFLTSNRHNYRLLLYTENKPDVKKTIKILSEILLLDEKEREVISGRIKNAKRKTMVSLIDNLAWDDLARIETNRHKLVSVAIETGILRVYNFPFETAHLIGYVASPSEKEISRKKQELFLHPDFKIGKSGFEKTFDKQLRGKSGVKYVEVNAFGLPIRDLSRKESVRGKEVKLTIDLNLQKFVTNRIKDIVASVIVMDIHSGEILALASSPAFDPNQFVEGISSDYWQQLVSDSRKPLNNKAISAAYPPGSTFKLIVAIAAMESGISTKKRVYCNGSYRLGRRLFRCWEKKGHGNLNMSDAIKYSCNSYFFDISRQVGIDKIIETAKRFGYGNQFDIGLSAVKSGNLPSKEWKKKIFKQKWVGGDTLNAAIGQGFVLTTPLQIAVATARIANGGIAINPHLLKSDNIIRQYEMLKNQPIASQKHLDLVIEGMNRVMNEKKGTAYYKRITKKGFEMAGKTGTAQVISKREDEMSKYEAKSHKNHAIFTGFAPLHQPKYAVSVVVEHGGSGSRTAAPIGRDVLLEVQKNIIV